MSLAGKKSTLTKAGNRLKEFRAHASLEIQNITVSEIPPENLQKCRVALRVHRNNLELYATKVRNAVDQVAAAADLSELSPEEQAQFTTYLTGMSEEAEEADFIALRIANILMEVDELLLPTNSVNSPRTDLQSASLRSRTETQVTPRTPRVQSVPPDEEDRINEAGANQGSLSQLYHGSQAQLNPGSPAQNYQGSQAQLHGSQVPLLNLSQLNDKICIQLVDPRNNLKPLTIPKFAGDPWEWDAFWTAYDRSVHSKSSLEKAEKLQYLLDSLTGDAKMAIARYRLSGENYDAAVEKLKTKYCRPEVIVHELSIRLDNLKASGTSAKAQMTLFDELSVMVDQLTLHNEAPCGTLSLQKILSKFAKPFQRKVLQRKANEQANDADWFWSIDWLLDNLLDILEQEEDIERTLALSFPESTEQKAPEQNKRSKPDSGKKKQEFKDNKGSSFKSFKCDFCNEAHRSIDCTKQSSVEQRIEFLKQEKRCFNCLKFGHMTSDCPSKGTCRQCSRRHHTAICKGSTSGTKPASATQQKQQTFKSANTSRKPEKAQSATGLVSNVKSQTHKVVQDDNLQDTTVLALGGGSLQYSRNRHPSAIMLIGQARIWSPVEQRLVKVKVLLDTAANRSFVTTELANSAQLPTVKHESVRVHGFAGQFSETLQEAVELTFFDQDDKAHKLTLLKADKITTQLAQPSLTENDWSYLSEKGLNLSLPPPGSSVEPHILVGMDQLHLILTTEHQLPSGPQLFPTRLGYVIGGAQANESSLTNSASSNSHALTVTTALSDEDEFKSAIRASESDLNTVDNPLEFSGTEKEEKVLVNQHVRERFTQTIEKRDDGYYVRLPWKENHEPLPHNHSIAFRRLQSVVRQLKDNPDLLEKYHQTFQDQLAKGILEEVPADEMQGYQRIHYIPHQAVVTPQKETTKLRVVFDASAHHKEQPSLNDSIHQGPLILPDLVGLLIRFRLNPVAFISDVEKAFLQVRLHEEDRDVCRCLWLKDPSRPVEHDNIGVYRFTRVTFGLNVSPFLLAATIEHHLNVTDSGSPQLREDIARNLYVDNLLTTAKFTHEANEKYLIIKEIFNDLNMNIREFMSNDSALNEQFDELDKDKNTSPSVLGLTWNTQEDSLSPKMSIPHRDLVTRRTMAQQLHSVYDPLGWCVPLLLPGKQLMQRALELDWDNPVNPELAEEWRSYVNSLRDFSLILPRQVACSGGQYNLVVFSDASKLAYGCCAYLSDGLKLHLLTAKSHLPQTNTVVTIPKLEMQALSLAVETAAKIVELLANSVLIKDIKFLCDSDICLGWLRRSPDRKETGNLVQNRIRSIRKVIDSLSQKQISCRFGYISTHSNPADCATRGVHAQDFPEHMWWTGPSFGHTEEIHWPEATNWFSLPVDLSAEPEETTAVFSLQTEDRDELELIDFNRIHRIRKPGSSALLVTAIRRVALVLRFVKRLCKNTQSPKLIALRTRLSNISDDCNPIMGKKELQAASSELYKFHQQKHLTEQQIRSMRDLDLRKNAHDVLECHGRLQNIDDSSGVIKRPILICPKSPLAEAIIRDAHVNSFHSGVSQTIAAVRSRFWVPQLRRQVQQVLKTCVSCQKINARPFKYPPMTALPTHRVQRQIPFSYIGLDYFDPITIRTTEEGGPSTAFGCIVTCLTTRMVHLELVPDGSTKSFLNALRRLFSRRGVPELIYLDNAPTFNLGEEILAETMANWTKDPEFQRFICDKAIEWVHITPFAPWQGGVYERLIKTIKDSWKKTFGKRIMSFDALQTVLSEIESTINCRPLTYQEANDQPILRPIDFIQRDMVFSVPLEGLSPEEDMHDPQYLPAQEQAVITTKQQAIEAVQSSYNLTERFWKIWNQQYLTALREQHKMHVGTGKGSRIAPAVGSVVLVMDPLLPRNYWRIARISQLKNGSDGQVREVELRTPQGRTLRRPVNLLVPLELDGFEIEKGVEEHIPPPAEAEPAALLEQPQPRPHDPVMPENYNLRPRRRVQYNEQSTEDIHMLTTRVSPTRGRSLLSIWPLTLMLLTLIPLTVAQSGSSSVSLAKAVGTIRCTPTGVATSTTNLTAMSVCSEGFCRDWSSSPAPTENVRFPAEIVLHGHKVTWKTSDGEEVVVTDIWCPSSSFCESIDCTFCTAAILNPECNPFWSIAAVGFLIYLLIMGCYGCLFTPVILGTPFRLFCEYTWKVLKLFLKGFKWCLKSIYSRLCSKKSERSELRGLRHRDEIREWLLSVTIVLALCIPAAHGACQEVDYLAQEQTKCFLKDGQEFCHIETTEVLKLNPLQREACIRLKSNSTILAQLSIRWQRLELLCDQETLFYTRDSQIQTVDSKRCPRTGSCIGNKCLDINETSLIPELDKGNGLPGRTGCVESCGGPGCDCFFLSSGCLFYRIFAIPRDDRIYRLFDCVRWKEQLLVTVTIADQTKQLVLHPNVPHSIPGTTVTLAGFQLPPLRALQQRFLDDGTNTAVWPHEKLPSLRCSSYDHAQNMSCPLVDDCVCESAETSMKCRCTNLDIGDEFVKMSNHLPVLTPALTLQPDNDTIKAVVDSLTSAELILHWKDRFEVISEVTDDRCSIPDSHVIGCYNCAKGGTVTFTCTSLYGDTQAQVDCGTVSFSARCTKRGSRNSIQIPSNRAQVRLFCSTQCGTSVTSFEITGILKYTTTFWESYRRIVEGESTIFNELQLPDLSHVLDVYFHWYKTVLLVVLILTVAVLLSYLYLATFGVRVTSAILSAFSVILSTLLMIPIQISQKCLQFFRAPRPRKALEKQL